VWGGGKEEFIPLKAVKLGITATYRKVNNKYEKREGWRYMAHDQDVL
jgi:hypothetical protein